MADRGGPGYGNDPGQQWQGGRPPLQPVRQYPPREYNYGVPNEREDADDGSPGRRGGRGNGRPGYAGEYGYSEPFDYVRRSAPPGRDQGYPQGFVNGDAEAAWPTAEPGGQTGWPDPAAGSPELGDTSEMPRTPPPAPSGGRADRRRAAKRIKRRRRLSSTKEIPILIGVALLIALVLKTFLVQAFVIPSGSMEETIRIGDRVLVDKLTPWFGTKPERGDVVVFKDPGGWLNAEETKRKEDPVGVKQGKELMTFIGLLPSDNEQDLIKRVIGVGGDKVKCCDAQGRVTVNGRPLKEPYLHPGNRPSDMKFNVSVPIGRVFVMGDHRANSADSRFHLKDPGTGTVPEGNVVGRAVVIAWPFGHWRRLEEPGTYASVPDARGATTAAPGAENNRVAQLPSPAELPLVIGVVGLSRLSGRRQWSTWSVRRDCGGPDGRRSFRLGRRRWGWRRRNGRPAP